MGNCVHHPLENAGTKYSHFCVHMQVLISWLRKRGYSLAVSVRLIPHKKFLSLYYDQADRPSNTTLSITWLSVGLD